MYHESQQEGAAGGSKGPAGGVQEDGWGGVEEGTNRCNVCNTITEPIIGVLIS